MQLSSRGAQRRGDPQVQHVQATMDCFAALNDGLGLMQSLPWAYPDVPKIAIDKDVYQKINAGQRVVWLLLP